MSPNHKHERGQRLPAASYAIAAEYVGAYKRAKCSVRYP